jgi:hypothetical protein
MKFMLITFVIIVITLTGTTFALAQDGENIEFVTNLFERWNCANDIAVRGDYAYITSGSTGLQIMDISNPEHPIQVGCYTDLGEVTTIDISGEYAYLTWSHVFAILDISEPSEPELVFVDHMDYSIDAIKISGDYVYLGTTIYHENDTSSKYVEILDISNPHEMISVTNCEWQDELGNRLMDICPVEDGVFVVSSLELYYLDLIEADSLCLAVTDNRFGGERIRIKDGIAYIMNNALLKIIDVSNAEEVEQIGECQTPTGCGTSIYDFIVDDEIVYVASELTFCGSPGRDDTVHLFTTVDVSNPSEPVIIKSTELQVLVNSLSMYNDDLAVNQGGGISIFDVSDPDTLLTVGCYNTRGYTKWLYSDGQTVFLLDNVMRIFDQADPENPVFVDYYDMNAYDAFVSEEILCAIGSDSIRIFDISEPELLLQIDSYPRSGWYSHMVINDPYIYMVQDEFLNVYEMTDADTLVPVCQFDVDDWGISSMDISDDVLYCAMQNDGIGIIDTSDPTELQLITHYALSGSTIHLQVIDDRCYAANSRSGLVILNVSDPAMPDSLGSIDIDDIKLHQLNENYVYVENDSMLIMIDVSNPENPVQAGYYNFNLGRYEDIEFVLAMENMIYIALRDSVGIFCNTLLDVEERFEKFDLPTELQLISTYPNPFNSTTTIEYALPYASEVSLSLYNLSGQRVETLVNGRMQAGVHRTMLDAGGMASGLYFLRLEGVGQSITQKIMLVK